MAELNTHLHIFLSSPSDLSEERKVALAVVDELNSSLCKGKGLWLQILSWGGDVIPTYGSDPQTIINDQIGDTYDIFIGIMWARFGSPTGRAGSGTEEEFNRACKRFSDNPGSLKIMFYFKAASPVNLSDIDPDQLKQVRQFKESIQKKAITGSFSKPNEFEQLLRMHLTRVVQEWQRPALSPAAYASADSRPTLQVSTDCQTGDELGLLDCVEEIAGKAESLQKTLMDITSAMNDISNRVQARATEISSFKRDSANLGTFKRCFDGLADDMSDFASRMRTNLPIFSRQSSEMIDYVQGILRTVGDFRLTGQDIKDIPTALNAIDNLRTIMAQTRHSILGLKNSVAAIPRLTTNINRSKARVTQVLQEYMDEMSTQMNLLLAAQETGQQLLDIANGPTEN